MTQIIIALSEPVLSMPSPLPRVRFAVRSRKPAAAELPAEIERSHKSARSVSSLESPNLARASVACGRFLTKETNLFWICAADLVQGRENTGDQFWDLTSGKTRKGTSDVHAFDAPLVRCVHSVADASLPLIKVAIDVCLVALQQRRNHRVVNVLRTLRRSSGT